MQVAAERSEERGRPRRGIRGGSHGWPVLSFRSAFRAMAPPKHRNPLIGFRVVVEGPLTR